MQNISLEELAGKAKVSKTTASLVLNGKGDRYKINKDTQQRILRVAAEYNYRPNFSARSLTKGRTMTIGLVVPNIADSFYSNIAFQLEQQLANTEYQLLMGSTRENSEREEALINTFLNRQVDALIVATTQKKQAYIERIYNSGIPVVLFDRHYPNSLLPHVIVDNYRGINKLIHHLQSKSRTNIGYVGLELELDAIKERQLAYNDWMKATSSPDFFRTVHYENYQAECEGVVSQLLQNGVDALLFETHYLALEGIKCMTSKGFHCPDDVSVVSFGDHQAFSVFTPGITVVHQPVARIAENCLELVFEQLKEGGLQSSGEIILEPELVIRNT
ncbi:LacI family DNA-binding transcriptional regulator [Carboxylicivirga sediminis]|uniref:LacI family DNA-binding transcriptional regulator n=1 Tax=Carboxylicivirga sediminis TaxID=2006564 RepID=A0A941F178_9BACT|nr:LacI family DNA-binding transcriptional regulator [Carboxylicivirga sediminis]MBR8534542.1 LacI family DNA-binding transcriptional regulator [Carboxylicivirga sediminis]